MVFDSPGARCSVIRMGKAKGVAGRSTPMRQLTLEVLVDLEVTVATMVTSLSPLGVTDTTEVETGVVVTLLVAWETMLKMRNPIPNAITRATAPRAR
jgi:hypothetical protein